MKVGLSGGIGCGKSTVFGFFREAGWQPVDSDMWCASFGYKFRIKRNCARVGARRFCRRAVDRAAVAKHVFGKRKI